MNLPHDNQIAAWLAAGPDEAPREALVRALAATHRTRKRPRWTFPERWLPMQLTMTRTRSPRPIFAIVSLTLLIVALVATALYVGSQRPLPLPQFRNGAIVYGQNGDLFIADQLGGPPRALTSGRDADGIPAFSPAGDRIAFTRVGEEYVRVMTVRPNGSDIREVWDGVGGFAIDNLDWSPDGSAIIVSGVGTAEEAAHVVRSDGSGVQNLDLGPNLFDFRLSWRPDGRHIAIDAQQDAGRGLWIAGADGTNLRPLPINSGGTYGMDWSPDGKHLSFVSNGPAGIGQVSIADIDEDGELTAVRPLRLDPESSDETWPKWSPDGSQLAVIVTRHGREHIGVVNPDGSGYRNVWPNVLNQVTTEDYSWSPDGRSLIISEPPETNLDGEIVGPADTSWMLDVATGELTEVQHPVGSWQRLAP
jgi:Tol biopolymer transport system component